MRECRVTNDTVKICRGLSLDRFFPWVRHHMATLDKDVKGLPDWMRKMYTSFKHAVFLHIASQWSVFEQNCGSQQTSCPLLVRGEKYPSGKENNNDPS